MNKGETKRVRVGRSVLNPPLGGVAHALKRRVGGNGPYLFRLALILIVVVTSPVRAAEHPLVLQTDFGLKDGAVAAMRGVAVGVSPKLAIYDLSHENTPYDIWEAAYRLKQTAPFWPE